MMFISQKDYIPPGTLRGALGYPAEPAQFTSAEYMAALERMELAHLSPARLTSRAHGKAKGPRRLTAKRQGLQADAALPETFAKK